jgi:hypothetical protein
MGANGEKIDRFLKFEIDRFAFLEERRFLKSPVKRYIFIEKTYLISHYPESRSSILSYSPVDTPLSLPEESRKLFTSLLELRELITNKSYNLLLKELLTKAKGFDQINIVFDHLLNYKNYDSETINFIIDSTINNWEIRNSFQAQNRMPKLVLDNIQLIKRDLVQKFISHFPRPNNLISADSKNQYEATMDKIKKSTGDNSNTPDLKRSRRDSYHRADWNLEIEAGEDELRKWDEEDPTWRIANDLD